MFLGVKILAALAVGVVAGLLALLIWGDFVVAGVAGGIWAVGIFLVLCGGGVAAPSTDDEHLGDDNAQMGAVCKKTSHEVDRLA